jgi:hypothetical protein
MHPVFLAELTADRQSRLLRQATAQRMLRTDRRAAQRPQPARWHLQSPIVRRRLATPCP